MLGFCLTLNYCHQMTVIKCSGAYYNLRSLYPIHQNLYCLHYFHSKILHSYVAVYFVCFQRVLEIKYDVSKVNLVARHPQSVSGSVGNKALGNVCSAVLNAAVRTECGTLRRTV